MNGSGREGVLENRLVGAFSPGTGEKISGSCGVRRRSFREAAFSAGLEGERRSYGMGG